MSAPSKTVFIVEGETQAVLVTNRAGKRSDEKKTFETPEAALQWCRTNAASLVYMPAAPNPARN